jgi:hypothetical protein
MTLRSIVRLRIASALTTKPWSLLQGSSGRRGRIPKGRWPIFSPPAILYFRVSTRRGLVGEKELKVWAYGKGWPWTP